MYPNPRLTPSDRSDSDSAPLPALRPLPYSHSAACLACRSNVVTLTRLISVENRNTRELTKRLVHTRQKKHCKRAPLGCTSSALGTRPTLHPAQANTPSPQSTRQLADATAQYQYSPKTFFALHSCRRSPSPTPCPCAGRQASQVPASRVMASSIPPCTTPLPPVPRLLPIWNPQ